MAKDPSTVANNWANRLAASTQAIADGVNGVQTAPGAAAARQADVWAQNVAASKPKWQRNVAAVTLPEWQAAMINKGVPRIASGAAAAEPKFQQFMSQLLPYIDQQVRALPARGTLDQNIARSAAFIRGMSKFQRQG